jgi:hypothetical protein
MEEKLNLNPEYIVLKFDTILDFIERPESLTDIDEINSEMIPKIIKVIEDNGDHIDIKDISHIETDNINIFFSGMDISSSFIIRMENENIIEFLENVRMIGKKVSEEMEMIHSPIVVRYGSEIVGMYICFHEIALS